MLALVCLCAVNGCKRKTDRAGTRPAASPYVVEVIQVQSRPYRATLSATGTLRARESVNLQVERAGIVTEINFEEGKPVKAGALLLAIDDSELQAQLRRAQAQLELATAVEKRDRELVRSGNLISEAEYDRSLANLHVAQAEVELIKAQLQKMKIVAPFDAVVGLRNISKGAYVTPGTSIASLQDISALKLDFTVPERYLSQLRNAETVTYRVAGIVQSKKAKIDAIEPAVNVATRSLQIRAIAPNEGNQLLPGSFAEVEVLLDEIPDAILIPAIALVPGLKEQKVFVHRNGQVEERVVRVGLRTSDSVQIEDGLKPDEELVITGILQLRPGTKVQVKQVPDEAHQESDGENEAQDTGAKR